MGGGNLRIHLRLVGGIYTDGKRGACGCARRAKLVFVEVEGVNQGRRSLMHMGETEITLIRGHISIKNPPPLTSLLPVGL
jgi:hypothetical protein